MAPAQRQSYRPICTISAGLMLPPSITRVAPLIQLAAWEARKMHGYATSSTVPNRPSARERSIICLTSSLGQIRSAAPSVVTGPGAIQLTRIPYRPHSPACDSVNFITPAFEAAYGSIVLEPCTPEVEDRLIMHPP